MLDVVARKGSARGVRRFLGLAALLLVACAPRPTKVRGEGDELRSFLGQDVETGAKLCPVCAAAGEPVLALLADVEDPALSEELAALGALAKTASAAAFAVLGRLQGGTLAPPARPEDAQERWAQERQRLGLRYRVLLVPDKLSDSERASHPRFEELYEVQASRTLLLADAAGKIAAKVELRPAEAAAQRARLAERLRALAR